MTSEGQKSPALAAQGEEILGKAYDSRLMLRLWVFVRPHWVLLLFAMFLMPLTVMFEIAQPYLLSIAIDVYIAHQVTEGLGPLALVFVGCVGLQAVSSYGQLYSLQLVGQRSMHTLRQATYRHVLTRRSAFFDRVPVGRLLTRMTNDVESINEMFSSGVVTLVADFIRLIAIVAMMLYLNVELTLITFVTIPVLVVLVSYARKLMRSSYRQIRVKLAAMNTHVQEHLSGIRVVQIFCREDSSARAYEVINAEYREAYEGSIRADASMYAIVEAIGVSSAAAIAWYSGSTIGEGVLTIGLIVAFIEYVNKFYIPIKDFSSKYAVMQSAMAAVERIVALLDTPEDDAPVDEKHAPLDEKYAQQGDERSPAAVEFRDVRFAYRPEEQVLQGLSLRLEPGQKVAVVGTTGSGKSTLIKLLARLYETNDGDIYLFGQNIRGISAAELRRRITVVNQDVFLFNGTLRENVKMGRLDASDADVEQALQAIGADKVMKGLGDGADMDVEDRGENLSAGERQLVAFARALVRDPEILILDEATAHVDPKTETIIEAGLDALMEGRTTLVIAHRLSTIRNADKIVVLARGVVAEQGSYDQLVALGGQFAALERSFSRER